ncbi:arylsulfatase [Spirosoma soli]|uniref:Arylsulfatase n=1 Tax=Spirosoma soli TaxID=1770529 RepID=A0ABW5M0Z5_9BACT
MYRRFAYLSLLCLLIISFSWAQQSPTKKRPNIIYIMADDLGYGNLTCYNPSSRVPTPNIDRMAKEGTRFTRHYSGNTVCAPSRCALMTGLHMGHAYVRGNGDVSLREQDTTVVQRLQANGYKTGMFGKWGLGREDDAGSPERKGFDEFFGYLNQRHAHNYYTDHLFEVKNRQIRKVPMDTTQYSHDLIMDRALAFVKANRNEPFFLYLPVTIPHAELGLPEKYMKPFLNADGSSKFGPETPFYQNRRTYHTQLKPHAAFAAMITKLDSDVGRVLALVKELGLDDNTYVFFTSDNGPHKEGGGDPDYFDSNGPLRGIKRDMYEGGIRVPMIARAPGRVPAGRTNDDIWAFWDMLPTFTQLTGTPTPTKHDGLSFVPALTGKPQKQHDYLYWQFNEGALKEAVVQGNWKLVRLKEKGKPEVLELYELSRDVGERQNVASKNSTRVKAMLTLMQQSKTPAENDKFNWSAMEQ